MYNVYFQINLNKTALQDKAEAQYKKQFWSAVLIYLIILGVLSYFLYKNDVKINEKIATKKEIITEIEEKLRTLEQSTRYVSEEDVLALASWEKNRLLWTKKMTALADILPVNMVYTKMIYDHNQLIINGIAEIREEQRELNLVLNLVNAIKAEERLMKDFYDVQFVYSNRISAGGQQVLQFSIKCFVKQPFASDGEYIAEKK